MILQLFSQKGFLRLFAEAEKYDGELSENAERILNRQQQYLKTIDPLIGFLQNLNPTLAHLICSGNYLPEASRFDQLADLEWAFGTMGVQDKARHLATLYLEDVSDLIVEAIDPHFGFSRYAERLGQCAYEFDELYAELNASYSFIDEITLGVFEEKLQKIKPDFVAVSVPFPGNLYSGFRVAQFVQKNHPDTQVCLGGGFANTELRSLSDPRVFEFFDFITLDDGERPIENLLEFLDGKRTRENLKRTFACIDGKVEYFNGAKEPDYKQKDVGCPDYSDLLLDKYLSVIEMANPMHRLWSDGRWNKLTLAHGCYWGKCTFCDISLDYIKVYEAASAKVLVDRIEEITQQTGQTGFHFVDEAAPPALMREVALEILRRGLTVVWWTNIRFEKSFTNDLCRLLAASGCIAVSGGLEVASDRLLKLIDKGVTVAQVARVSRNFTEAGIMVHAYLMYGYPTQTEQETIDSLEMVRQLFMHGVIQSGFWHQFAMTSHSPVGLEPEKFGVKILNEKPGTFANNDLFFEDPVVSDHGKFSDGLKKSLFNYMHGACFDFSLSEWFEFETKRTTIPKKYIQKALEESEPLVLKESTKMYWLETLPKLEVKGKDALLYFSTRKGDFVIQLDLEFAEWLQGFLQNINVATGKNHRYPIYRNDFEWEGWGNLEEFLQSEEMLALRESGLLIL